MTDYVWDKITWEKQPCPICGVVRRVKIWRKTSDGSMLFQPPLCSVCKHERKARHYTSLAQKNWRKAQALRARREKKK